MLRGLGVSMASPWLESMPAFADPPNAKTSGDDAPPRMGALFGGNGFHHGEYHASGEGAAMALGQVIAQQYGHRSKSPSLVLGCGKANLSIHKNYSMNYSSHISWSSPTTPTPLEVYLALAFDRLFKHGNHPGDGSVLDSILEEGKDMRRRMSASDKQKLDEYLNSVREVEKRIENAGQRGELECWRPTLNEPNLPRPADGIPQDIGEHMRRLYLSLMDKFGIQLECFGDSATRLAEI